MRKTFLFPIIFILTCGMMSISKAGPFEDHFIDLGPGAPSSWHLIDDPISDFQTADIYSHVKNNNNSNWDYNPNDSTSSRSSTSTNTKYGRGFIIQGSTLGDFKSGTTLAKFGKDTNDYCTITITFGKLGDPDFSGDCNTAKDIDYNDAQKVASYTWLLTFKPKEQKNSEAPKNNDDHPPTL